MKFRKLSTCAALVAVAFSTHLFATEQSQIDITRTGRASFSALAAQPTERAAAARPRVRPELGKPRIASNAVNVDSSSLYAPGLPVVGPGAGFLGFTGLTSLQQAQVSGEISEPPDQALAVSGSQVVEAINVALRVYSTSSGKPLSSPVSLYDFFGVPATDKNGNIPLLSDPRVYYDKATNRWFITMLRYTIDATTSGFVPSAGSTIFLGVSTSGDATGDYNIYEIDASLHGRSGCPCLGDQPLLGANQDGIFLGANEYSLSNLHFVTDALYALDKRALANGSSTVGAERFTGLKQQNGPGFEVQPAIYAPGANTSANKGTEYLLSSLDFAGTVDNRLTIWALTNTGSLRDSTPNLHLSKKTLVVEAYGQPPAATQKKGSRPLGKSLGEPLEQLDTNDDRMQQVYFAGGSLYGSLTTVILSKDGTAPRAGIAWFVLDPSSTSTSVSAETVNQGYIAVTHQNVMFPAVAVTTGGRGVIGFSMSGPSYFPSTAYVDLNTSNIGDVVHLAGRGQAPEDGFSGYKAFGGDGVARWGDYSAAAVTPGGHVWFASEFTPDTSTFPRTQYTNYGTFVARVR